MLISPPSELEKKKINHLIIQNSKSSLLESMDERIISAIVPL